MSVLDLFLLALIGQGYDSAYRLQAEAGLSVGASLPALSRLRRYSWIEVGAREGGRGRRKLSLTRKGQEELKRQVNGLDSLLEHPPADVESILRAITVARLFRKNKLVQPLLEAAITEIERRDADRRRVFGADKSEDPISFYRNATVQCESTRNRALVQALRRLSKELA